ncbi:MAG: hypothetical protein R3F41_12525 [Gammaproteobacteria bacterium]|nr:hypothetical protein [Pseudomonadales bacterium]MCP5348922.1 hypothetical protein [Pseudomonadales bacterium]
MLQWQSRTIVRISLGALALLAGGAGIAQDYPHPNYAEDVAGIFQDKCQICHQPNSVAPMALLTYEEVQPWIPLIRMRVSAREMPPWHLNPVIGIQDYKNDLSLTERQRQTILDWVDSGAPAGPDAALPAVRSFPDPNRWQLGDVYGREPDLIVRSAPFDLAAATQDKWFRPTVDTGLTEDRWVQGMEVRPSYPLGRRAVHHVLLYQLQDRAGEPGSEETGQSAALQDQPFMEWAIGKVGDIFPAGTGKLLKAGARIGWDLHLHAIGQEIKGDTVELGVWLYPRNTQPRHPTVLRSLSALGEGGIDIRPNETAMLQQFHVVEAPARLENFQPHLHRVGKGMSLEVIYPDGRRELLSYVDNFQWQWNNNYIYADDAAPLIPAGSTLVVTAWYDNTDNNPDAPDPRQWVGYGERAVDEMGHAWVNFTYLEQDEFDRLWAERQARKAAGATD